MQKTFTKKEQNEFKKLLSVLENEQIKNIKISFDGGLTLGETNEFVQVVSGDFEISMDFNENAFSENITISWEEFISIRQ
ncbi:MAG: hypothetical protein PHF25_03295 [Candidatus Margulisbacteria bacterium]|nr:hypothetical protein [Candidatus Margulisiibacteriota bacterium]